MSLNKRILVIGFQFLVISFQQRPMNREKNCKYRLGKPANSMKNLWIVDWKENIWRDEKVGMRLIFSDKNDSVMMQKNVGKGTKTHKSG